MILINDGICIIIISNKSGLSVITCKHPCIWNIIYVYKVFKDIFLLDISLNSNYFEMTDTALDIVSVILVFVCVYV